MSIPFSQVRGEAIKLKVTPSFNSVLVAGAGIRIDRLSPVKQQVSVDFSNLERDDITSPIDLYVGAWDTSEEIFKLVKGDALKGDKGEQGDQGDPGPITPFDFATRAIAAAATIGAPYQYVRLGGFASAGDGGDALYKRVGSEPSHAGKFQSADGSWWELASSLWNIRMFGAGTTSDDTSAINNAMYATCYAGKGELRLTAGSFVVSGRLVVPTITSKALKIIGAGTGATVIIRAAAYTSGDIFYFGTVGNSLSSWVSISDLTIIGSSGTYVTSGYAFNLAVRECVFLRNILIYDGFGGISLFTCGDIFIDTVIFMQSITYANTLGPSEAGLKTGGIISNIFVRDCGFLGGDTSSANNLSYGIYIGSSDGMQFTNCFCVGNYGIFFEGGAGTNVDDAYFVNCIVDNCRVACVAFQGNASAAHVYTNLRFSGCHFNVRNDSGLNNGANVLIGGNVDFVEFVGCNLNLSGYSSISITGALNNQGGPRQSLKFADCDISGNVSAGSRPTVLIDAGVTGVQITGCTIANRNNGSGSSNYAIALQGGNSNIIISDNVLTPQLTGAIYYGAGSHSNLLIQNNLGCPDFVEGDVNPTVGTAYGPLYIGSGTVAFATGFQEAPKVNAVVTSIGNGGVSVAITGVGTTGFSYSVIGVTNGGFVPFHWIARGH